MDWSRRTFPAVKRITIRWKLDLILFESAKSHFFDTSSWGEFCDVTLTLKQALQPDRGGWVKIDDYRCRQAFRQDRKSTRLNSSHQIISYAVFCLKKKKQTLLM